MWTFQDTFETRKQSVINAFSISVSVHLNILQNLSLPISAAGKVSIVISINGLDFESVSSIIFLVTRINENVT